MAVGQVPSGFLGFSPPSCTVVYFRRFLMFLAVFGCSLAS